VKAVWKYKVLSYCCTEPNHLPNAKDKLKALQLKERAECPARIQSRLLIQSPRFHKKVIESWKTYQIYTVFRDAVRKIKAIDEK